MLDLFIKFGQGRNYVVVFLKYFVKGDEYKAKVLLTFFTTGGMLISVKVLHLQNKSRTDDETKKCLLGCILGEDFIVNKSILFSSALILGA